MMIVVDYKKAIIVAIATFIGSQLSFILTNKLEHDNVWIFEVIPSDREDGKNLADIIRVNNIAVVTFEVYNDYKEKVIGCKIYSQSKEHSRLIESLIPDGCKYHIHEVKNFYIN